VPHPSDLPSLDELGRDLLDVAPWRRALSLSMPFVLAAAFFALAARGHYLLALLCTVAQSFLTYGSISHDLVHRTLRLPRAQNEVLLSAIELLAFRCGHAYRAVHLNHHARFPAPDDVEGAAAHLGLWGALLEGVTLQPRLLLYAIRTGRDRAVVLLEATLVSLSFAACLWAWAAGVTWLPLAYAGLVIAGSWVFPVVTSYIPHDPMGDSELTQTRLFRGRVARWLSVEHLYHLEHHLYPGVPHHNWPALARRLDPHFARLGLRPVVWLF
jgi:beta-carotene hydroxylase